MSEIKYTGFGKIIGLQMKLMKHIEENNPDRVKDYLCAAFDNWEPKKLRENPAIDVIRTAETFMRNHGWKVGLYNWGEEKGWQYTCVSPEDGWYHSHYNYNK